MVSEAGTTLTLQPDNSILADGPSPDNDGYIFETEFQGRIEAIRLEAIPDPSLPAGGSGRAPTWGSFVLTDFRATLGQSDVALSRAAADFSQDWRNNERRDSPIAFAIDENESTGWAIWPLVAEPHSAVFAPSQPMAAEEKATLKIRLAFGSQEMLKYTLGRFRLSVTSDAEGFLQESRRLAALKLTSPWLRLAAAYRALGESDMALMLFFHAYDLAPGGSQKAEIARQLAEFDDVFPQFLTRYSNDKWVQLGQARSLAPRCITEQKFQEAVDVLMRAIALFPDDRELLSLRAEAYGGLRDWQAALGDLSQVIERETDETKKRAAEHRQAEAQIRLGQTAEAAEGSTLQMLMSTDWDTIRNAYAAQLLAGNPGVARMAASRLDQQLASKTDVSAFWNSWLVRTHTAVPGLATTANRQKLLDAARKAGGGWTAPMTAAIHYRLGNLNQADELLLASAGKPQFQALAAMLLYERGKPAEAKAILSELENRFQRELADDPGSAVPAHVDWQDWAIERGVYREAVRKLAGASLLDLDTRLSQEPDNADVLLERADLLSAIGLHAEGLIDLSKAEKLNANAGQLPGLKGRILAGLDRTEEALENLNAAIDKATTDPRVYAARGGILLKQGQTEPARIDLEKSLDIEPTELAARHLSGLLLEQAETRIPWTVLEPRDMQSTSGATLTQKDDGSILLSGTNASGDLYRMTATTDLERIAVVRLEALPDESLPKLGPGRHSSGLFQVSEFRVLVQMGEDASDLAPLPVASAWADFDAQALDAEIVGAIHPVPNKALHIRGRFGEPHQALFLIGKPATLIKGRPLTIELRHTDSGVGTNLGRFRVSISADPLAYEHEKGRIDALLAANPWTRLATAYRLSGEEARLEALIEKRPDMAAYIAESLAASRDWARAVPLYNNAVASSPNDGELLAKRAEALGRLDRWEEADKDWQKALELKPNDEALRGRWLDSLTIGQRLDDIAREYSRQLDALPEGHISHTPRGQLMAAIARRHDPVIERLMALRPDDPLPRLAIARDFILQNDWANAAKEFDKLVPSRPPGEEGYEYIAALLLADKREAAKDHLKTLVARTGKPVSPAMGYVLARAAILFPEETVPWADVIAWAESAAVDQRGWFTHVAGMASLRAGQLDQAKVWLDLSSATTWHPELRHLALGLLHTKQGNTELAREEFQKAQDWLKQEESEKRDGYYAVQDTDWLEFQILLREAEQTQK